MNTTEKLLESSVNVYETHQAAESAVITLSKAGFNMKHLSIVGQEYYSEEQPVGFISSGTRMVSWGKFGAFWGTMWGLLFGSAFIFVPGLGPLVLAGYIVGAIEGAFIGGGIGVLGAAFASLGIPDDKVVQYEANLNAGKFLLIVHGTSDEILVARDLLKKNSFVPNT
jgi:uncharacterized membrane protein